MPKKYAEDEIIYYSDLDQKSELRVNGQYQL